MATFEVGKPAPYYCKACEAVPQAGYCKMAGCPTNPEPSEPVRDERDAFEAWAIADSRCVQPEEGEERKPENGLYYVEDSTNQAYIGWRVRAAADASPELKAALGPFAAAAGRGWEAARAASLTLSSAGAVAASLLDWGAWGRARNAIAEAEGRQ